MKGGRKIQERRCHMFSVVKTEINENNYFKVCQYACLSTDSKSTDNVRNGAICIEMDTSKVYMFDAANAQWRELSL